MYMTKKEKKAIFEAIESAEKLAQKRMDEQLKQREV